MRATRFAALIWCAALTGCGAALPDNVVIDTPLAEIALGPSPAPAPADSCLVVSGSLDGGQIVIGPGFQCAPQNTSIGTDAITSGGSASTDDALTDAADVAPATSGPSADPLADTIRAAEGQLSNFPYCDPAGLHAADGVWIGRYLSDREREAWLCQAIEDAREQAERTIGDAWADLSQPRKDVWIELCYWAHCAGFVDAIRHIREGSYEEAAGEIVDSCLYYRKPTCPPGSVPNVERASRLVRDMISGERG